MQDTTFAPKRANIAPGVARALAGMVGYAKCKGKMQSPEQEQRLGGGIFIGFIA